MLAASFGAMGLLSRPRPRRNSGIFPTFAPPPTTIPSTTRPTLNVYLNVKPDYFKTELKLAWGFWKTNFIQSNGLVNHKRLVNNQLTGANEAVSEGQGYGMLLSVLINDQATFNRVFEAANANMWDNGRKSYFIWNWPNGSQGAATDADLDIGLALVFADELQKEKLWQPYNKGGITYNSRAMDIIKSIRTNMTSQNYLLPGDNWGGDGVNNLNPSYFATAWLKVFNAYQKRGGFHRRHRRLLCRAGQDAQVFRRARRRIGAPQGRPGQPGRQQAGAGLGMLSDAIRTPWRIAMDAFGSTTPAPSPIARTPRNPDGIHQHHQPALLAAQMAQYTKAGAVGDGYPRLVRQCGPVVLRRLGFQGHGLHPQGHRIPRSCD